MNKEERANYAMFKAFTYFQHAMRKEPINLGRTFSSSGDIIMLLEDFDIPSEFHSPEMISEVFTDISDGRLCLQTYKLPELRLEIQIKSIRTKESDSVLMTIDEVTIDEKVLNEPLFY